MSAQTQHTPGPWYADRRGHIWRYGGGVAGDKPLAAVSRGWYGEDESGYPVEANARLIAAAPDLLAVVEEAIRLYGKPGGPWNVPSDPGGWIARAQAAVAKARGGER